MPKRIAIIRDGEGTRENVESVLKSLYDVRVYDSHPRSLETMRAVWPSLILLELSADPADGYRTAELLRSDANLGKVPILALAPVGSRSIPGTFLGELFDELLARPIRDEWGFLSLVSRLLSRAETKV